MISDLPLNLIAIFAIYLFIFVYIVRMYLLSKVLAHLKEEYISYYKDINPHDYSFVHFLTSGKLIFFSFHLMFRDELSLDQYLISKKHWLLFLSFLYVGLIALMIYLIYVLRVISL